MSAFSGHRFIKRRYLRKIQWSMRSNKYVIGLTDFSVDFIKKEILNVV